MADPGRQNRSCPVPADVAAPAGPGRRTLREKEFSSAASAPHLRQADEESGNLARASWRSGGKGPASHHDGELARLVLCWLAAARIGALTCRSAPCTSPGTEMGARAGRRRHAARGGPLPQPRLRGAAGDDPELVVSPPNLFVVSSPTCSCGGLGAQHGSGP